MRPCIAESLAFIAVVGRHSRDCLAVATLPSERGNGRLPKHVCADAGSPHRLRGGRTAPHRGDAGWPQSIAGPDSETGGMTAQAATTAAARSALVRVLRYGFSANPVEVQGLFMAMMIVAVGLFLSRFSILAKAGSNFGAFLFLHSILRAAARSNRGRDDGTTPAPDRLGNAAAPIAIQVDRRSVCRVGPKFVYLVGNDEWQRS